LMRLRNTGFKSERSKGKQIIENSDLWTDNVFQHNFNNKKRSIAVFIKRKLLSFFPFDLLRDKTNCVIRKVSIPRKKAIRRK
jgi:hypothetical protein